MTEITLERRLIHITVPAVRRISYVSPLSESDKIPLFPLDHRFPTVFEAGIPCLKIKGRSHPFIWKNGKNHKNSQLLQKNSQLLFIFSQLLQKKSQLLFTKTVSSCSFSKLQLAIRRPADNVTENTQSYCLTFTPYCSLETNLVTYCCCFSPLISWRTIIRSETNHAQGAKWFRYLLFKCSREENPDSHKYYVAKDTRQGFCTQFSVT